MPIERRLWKDDTLQKGYQESIDNYVKTGYVRKVENVQLNENRDTLQWNFATSRCHQPT